uniref:Extracellular metalloprotease 1 (EC) n=1 Tax=Ganoderma boninense TaxID=34458 RepID=A0A5K1JSC6_9APHY|nr:Extracellular metalloprotease 1 (EC [Ganoderma boninense]
MDVDSRQLIDAQFDRAVEIVQGLPKTGPIQTGYEEKLDMYRDAWAKHNDLDPYEAKWLYVDALLKVLRKYSDKTVARDLVRELESYAGDPANLVMSGVSARSPGSSSSSSSVGNLIASSSQRPAEYLQAHPRVLPHRPADPGALESETDDETSDEEDEAADTVPATIPTAHVPASQLVRPQSTNSSRPFRTPMASTLLVGSPPPINVPMTQPHPGFHTQSAFAESTTSIPSIYPTTTVSYPEQARSPPSEPVPSGHGYPSRAGLRPQTQTPFRQYSLQSGASPRPASLPMLERAVESVQAHLAAITERLETLEGVLHHSSSSLTPSGLPARRGSPFGNGQDVVRWDIDDMGMWSLVLHPWRRGPLAYVRCYSKTFS